MNHHHPPTEPNDDDLLDRLVEQFTDRIRAGETPSIREYQDKHPQLSDEIHELLSSVAMIEGLKQQSSSVSGERAKFEKIELDRIGEYRIERELGRGGMGIVFEAVHESLGRRVAIKILPSRLLDNEKYVERFTREARAAATLHHNNIVSVFGVGHSDGLHYYVMEHIEGKPLDLVIQGMRANSYMPSQATKVQPTLLDHDSVGSIVTDDDFQLNQKNTTNDDLQFGDSKQFKKAASRIGQAKRDPSLIPTGVERFQWAADMIADIADALQYAHEQGVLHRDVKPGNLLLDPNGRLWLTDFGLVKNLGNQSLTMAGEVIGTPRYMAPESFEGKYDVTSETYCLGTTLYELTTLQPVCEETSPAETIRRITTSKPTRPRKIDPRIPRDLETIIEKAVNTDSTSRYQSAADLRDDLRAFVESRPIAARSTSMSKRIWLWCKRNPWQTISAALFALAAVVATAGFISRSNSLAELAEQNEQLKIERDNTKEARELAEANAIQLREQFDRAEANIALSNEWLDAMIRQLVRPGGKENEQFSFDSYRELSGVETTISQKDALYLENMLGFVRRFAEQNSENKELAFEAGRAFRRVANIYHLLGRRSDAASAYRDAIRFYDSLLKRQPDAVFAVDQIQTSNELILLLLTNRDYKSAATTIKKTIKKISESEFSDQYEMQLEWVRTLNLKGTSAPIEALESVDNWLVSFDEARPRGRRRERRGLFPRRQVQKLARENLAALTEATELVNQLVKEYGELPELILERSKCQSRLAEIQFGLKDVQASQVAKQQALEDLKALSQAHENEPDYREVLAQTYALPVDEDNQVTLDYLNKAAAITEALCDEWSENPNYSQLNAEINFQLGQLHRDLENQKLAIKHFQMAQNSMYDVLNQAPRNPQIRIRYNLAIYFLAELLVEDQQFRRAEQLLESNSNRFKGWERSSRASNSPAFYLFVKQAQLLHKCYVALDERVKAERVYKRILNMRKSRDSKPPRDKKSPRRKAK